MGQVRVDVPGGVSVALAQGHSTCGRCRGSINVKSEIKAYGFLLLGK